MSVTLLAFGILLTGAGLAAVGFGIPINDLPLGNTLLIVGAIGVVGGLQLIGLSAAVADLAAIRKSLLARLAPRASRSAEPTLPGIPDSAARPAPDQQPAAPAPAVEVSASVIERMRSNIPRPERTVPVAEEVPLSPNGSQSGAHADPAVQAPARAGGAAVETLREPREPRLDFLFRPKPARPAPTENFDAMWPKRPAPGDAAVAAPVREEAPAVSVEPAYTDRPAESTATPEEPVQKPAAPPPEPARSVAILKSGVVDGMAYTLYADGSNEAQLPQGTVRFGSIAELRAHIESNA